MNELKYWFVSYTLLMDNSITANYVCSVHPFTWLNEFNKGKERRQQASIISFQEITVDEFNAWKADTTPKKPDVKETLIEKAFIENNIVEKLEELIEENPDPKEHYDVDDYYEAGLNKGLMKALDLIKQALKNDQRRFCPACHSVYNNAEAKTRWDCVCSQMKASDLPRYEHKFKCIHRYEVGQRTNWFRETWRAIKDLFRGDNRLFFD